MMNAPGELLDELVRAHSDRWTHSDEILALILEAVDDLRQFTRFVWMKEDDRPRRVPPPIRYPRPARVRAGLQQAQKSTRSEIRRFFGGKVMSE